jgi:hypothetical protein
MQISYPLVSKEMKKQKGNTLHRQKSRMLPKLFSDGAFFKTPSVILESME